MKKILSAGLFLSLLISIVTAQTPSIGSVESIPEKDDQLENTVSTAEFNALVKTLRGIYNFVTDGRVQIGLNEDKPAKSLTLDINGRIGAQQYCDGNGEHCIDPATWDVRPVLGVEPPAANCQVRYKVKDQKYESDWQFTGSNNDPIGAVARFHSGLAHNCEGPGCGVIMSLKCSPNPAITNNAACRLRYRINHLKTGELSPWVSTTTTDVPDTWVDGEWSIVSAPGAAWGDGLSLQTGIDCLSPELRCQVGYKIHNETESTPWVLSQATDGEAWQDTTNKTLSASTRRACDQVTGCGLQIQSRCVGTTSTLKTLLYSCPKEGNDLCPSDCNGHISQQENCRYQEMGSDGQCDVLITKECEKLGYLVQ